MPVLNVVGPVTFRVCGVLGVLVELGMVELETGRIVFSELIVVTSVLGSTTTYVLDKREIPGEMEPSVAVEMRTGVNDAVGLWSPSVIQGSKELVVTGGLSHLTGQHWKLAKRPIQCPAQDSSIEMSTRDTPGHVNTFSNVITTSQFGSLARIYH